MKNFMTYRLLSLRENLESGMEKNMILQNKQQTPLLLDSIIIKRLIKLNNGVLDCQETKFQMEVQ